jgi:hypothetical protein
MARIGYWRCVYSSGTARLSEQAMNSVSGS